MRLRLISLMLMLLVGGLALAACRSLLVGPGRAMDKSIAPGEGMMNLQKQCADLKAMLIARHGDEQKERIERGVDQVAAFWRPADGDFSALVTNNFVADPQALAAMLARLESVFEQLDGHLHEANRALRWPTDVEVGPLLPIDFLLAGYDPSANLTEDLFRSQVGMVVLLNFGLTTLHERLSYGAAYSREQWAQVRLAGRFACRVPGEVRQKIAQAAANADLYVAQYNLWMHHLLAADGQRLFPKGLRLISHWGLRDELKASYADSSSGLAKQRLIAQVMTRIVTDSIPASVVENPRLDWEPLANTVTDAPAAEIEEGAPAASQLAPDARYALWLEQFKAHRLADDYSPTAPTLIARSFEMQREMSEERVVQLLNQILTSPQVASVAALIGQRLGRKLEPHDIWYSGFASRGEYSEAQLDELVKKRYPTAQAFADDIPRMLKVLGFAEPKAKFIAEHIAIDPARGAGHAMPAMRRGDIPRLRTRVGQEGMDYKGYHVAMHELGHNVEQVLSLYEVDHTLLAGVPNTAFTEAFAFIFQARDLMVLGLVQPDVQARRNQVLHDFWTTVEIAGVAMVDIKVWHWLYDHPQATPAQLREAVVLIAQDVWNSYFASIFSGKDSVLLGIYSHLIAYPLYMPDYPLGHLIAFQIEEHLRKSPAWANEFERMAKFGAVTPDAWMMHATGEKVSAQPLLKATQAAMAKTLSSSK